MNKEWTPRRGRLLTTIFCDGRATYRLWYIFLYTLRFYLCFYTFITQVYHSLKKIGILSRIRASINPLKTGKRIPKKLLFTHNHFIINKNFNFHSQIIPASALIPPFSVLRFQMQVLLLLQKHSENLYLPSLG